jgi:hypothetical protein
VRSGDGDTTAAAAGAFEDGDDEGVNMVDDKQRMAAKSGFVCEETKGGRPKFISK